MEQTNQPENRKARRIPFIKEVLVEGLGTVRCSEISTGGMYIETIAIFQIGATINLKFKLVNTDEQPIQVSGQVMYIHDGVGMGVAFSNLSPKDREKIEKIVNRH